MKAIWRRAALLAVLLLSSLCLLVGCGGGGGGFGGLGGNGGGNNGDIVITYYITANDTSPVSVRMLDGSTFRITPPTRTGYTFLGLFDAPEGGIRIVNEQGYLAVTPSASITLYGQWEPDVYTLVLQPAGGELISQPGRTQYTYGSELGALPVPVLDGYDFVGWTTDGRLCTDKNGLPLSGMQTVNSSNYSIGTDGTMPLVALYERKKIIVTFNYNDGSYRTEEKQVLYGETLAFSEFPFPDTGSSEVRGWSYMPNSSTNLVTADLTNLKQDTTLYAVWNPYKLVEFVEVTGVSQTLKVYQNTPYTPYEPVRFGYEFDGWYASPSFSGNPVTQIQYHNAKDIYYANWWMADYRLDFVVGGDVIGNPSPLTYTIEDEVVLPTVSRAHYEFLGWSETPDDREGAVRSFPVGSYGDKTLYPVFRGERVGVVLNAVLGTFGGTSATYRTTLEYGAKGTLRVPTYEGYAFVGYFLDETQITDGEGNLLANYEYSDEVTLTAKYDQKRFVTVDIPHEAGTVQLKPYYVAGEKLTLTYVPTKAGYTFLGFYNGEELLTEDDVLILTVPEGNLDLSVRVKANTYTVTLNKDGGFGTDVEAVTVTYGETFTLPILYKNGMLFGGWRYGNSLLTDENGVGTAAWSLTSGITVSPVFTEDTSGITTYYISTPEELLQWMSDPTARFVLIADINMTGVAYAPTGTFEGTFDGAGHAITGLTTSLFHEVTGTVRNLTVEAAIAVFPKTGLEYYGILANHLKGKGTVMQVTVRGSITANMENTQYDIGGVVGVARGESVLKSCVSYATLVGNAAYGEGSTGGIVGSIIENATLSGCMNYGPISGPFVGGVAGHFSSSKYLVENCENHGDLLVSREYGAGIIGYAATNVNLTNCRNTALVVGTAQRVGGLVGIGAKTVAMTDCHNEGDVRGTGYLGGLAGWVKENVTLTNCRSDADITGTASYVGGLVGNVGGTVDAVKCSAKGTVTAENEAGGFFGYIGAGSVTDSTVETAVEAGGYVGGFVGRSSKAFAVTNSRTSAEVTGTSNVGKYAGSAGSCTVSGVEVDIANAEQLLAAFKYGTAKGEIYNLTGDIDLDGCEWKPIAFHAVLNGGGHTIKNLTVISDGADVGMFTTLDGTVENLIFENVSITATSLSHIHLGTLAGVISGGGVTGVTVKSGTLKIEGITSGDVGGIAGQLTASVAVAGCESHLIIDGNNSDTTGSTGGIVGWMTNGTVSACKNYGEITGAYHTGGIVGGISSAGTVSDCENHGAVTGTVRTGGITGAIGHTGIPTGVKNVGTVCGTDNVGGLFGYLSLGAFSKNITALSNEGDVVGRNNVGGIFGYFRSYSSFGYNSNTQTITLSGLSNSGTVTGADYVGGLFGYTQVYSDCNSGYTAWIMLTMSQLSATGDVTGTRYVGGLFGYIYSDNGSSVLQDSSASCTVTVNGSYGGAIAGYLDNIALKASTNEGSTVIATEYTIDGSTYYAFIGGYIGRGASIYSCINASDILYDQKGIYVGGIAGYINGHIQGCQNGGTIDAPKASYVGGLVGRANYGTASITYSGLSNSGAVTGSDYTGGIFGYVYSTGSLGYNSGTYTFTASSIKNTGEIRGASFTGGICGYLYLKIDCNSGYTAWSRLVATQLQNVADVTGTQYVGGLFGSAYSDTGDSSITGSASSGNITAEYLVGGLAGKLENIRLESSTNEGTAITATGYFIDGSSYYAYIGGYVGFGYLVNDCDNASDITYKEKGVYVGGIVGYTYSNVTNCENSGEIYAPKASYVGGIAGRANYGNQSVSFTDLTNTADITGADYTAGIIGYVYSTAGLGYNNGTYTFTVKNLKNEGNITGGTFTAGIFAYYYTDISCNSGYTAWSQIVATKLKNTGDITGGAYVGGLFGYAHTDNGDSTVTDSSSSADITAEYYVGGLAGKLENIQVLSCSNAGTTITATGYQIDGSNYNAYVGGYVGYGYLIDGCDNAVSITYNEKGRFVGGIAGYINHNLKNCTNTADVYAPDASYVGGLVGHSSYTTWSPTYTNLTNSGNVTGAAHTGGIVGEIYAYGSVGYNNSTHTFTMTSLKNSGSVTGAACTGGIVGYIYLQIDCNSGYNAWMRIVATMLKNTGDITGESHVGGLFGYAHTDNGDSTISDSSSSADITGKYYVGGLAGQLENIQLLSSSNEGSTVTATEYQIDGSNYNAFVGGYVGRGYLISGCHNAVPITYDNLGRFVGGIAGYITHNLLDCTNTADIYAPRSSHVGGLVGYGTYSNWGPTFRDLENSGKVTGLYSTGGIIGEMYSHASVGYNNSTQTVTMTNVKNTGAVTGTTNVGGIGGRIWMRIDCNSGYTAWSRVIATKVTSTADVTAESVGGGLFGEFYSDGSSEAHECSYEGVVTVGEQIMSQPVGSEDTNLTFKT